MYVSLKQLKCTGCKKFLNRVPGQRQIIKTEDEVVHFGNILQRTIAINDTLCNKCRRLQSKRIKIIPMLKTKTTNNQLLMIRQSIYDLSLK